MGELEVPPEVIDKCQNHKETNRIRRTYQRQKYWRQMIEAWDVLGEKLDELYLQSLE